MRIFFPFLSAIFSLLIASTAFSKSKTIPLVPYPQKVNWNEGNFKLSSKIGVECPSPKLKDYFISQLKSYSGLELNTTSKGDNGKKIIYNIDSVAVDKGNEAYILSVTKDLIKITSSTEEGLFRGTQTLFQLIPASDKAAKNPKTIEIQCCNIEDAPAFSWRGLNLDCARHFMSKDFIKRYIDILAYYKINVFHWHLTDDQGWRIEIKKYPKLTEVGAFRKEADGSVYGGFYTQDDIKEVVAYAQSRYITIVPEIEMPGHSQASLASYPENSCTGGPFEVANTWGVIKDIYCAGNDSTYIFLENVLDEVISLFPGKYIHIGGDEAPKDRWKACPKCQAKIKAEGLKNENELQSYFVKKIAHYLYSKGKDVIGWEEILQGGLAPGTIVQSWLEHHTAVDAAMLKHYTIFSPASNTYLDSDAENLDLRVAYSFNPVPQELPAEYRKYILGSEVSLWSERAPQEKVDARIFPRLLAFSEVVWTNPSNKNYDEFLSRVRLAYDDLTARGIQYGPETKALSFSTSYNESKKEFTVTAIPGQKDLTIRYTENGMSPDSNSEIYKAPIIINKTTNLKMTAFRDNHIAGRKYSMSFDFHKALNAKIKIVNKYDEHYRAGGDNGVIDGIRATENCHDGLWQGYEGVDFEAVIDLGKTKEISEVSPRFLLDSNSWIFLPVNVEISLSDDGVNFTNKQIINNDVPQKNSDIILKDFKASFNKQSVRYIKVKAESIKKCPEWHPGAGQKAWLFIDEIEVN